MRAAGQAQWLDAVPANPHFAHYRRDRMESLLWVAAAVAAYTDWELITARPGWPALWRVLLAYAFSARVPVLVVMFLSIFGGWDTHYAKPRPGFPDVGNWGLFFWTAVVPQLSVWIWMTITLGMIFGAVALAVRRPGRSADAAPIAGAA